MLLTKVFPTSVSLFAFALAESWPYNRVLGQFDKSGKYVPDKTSPEFASDPDNLFVGWLHQVVNKSPADSQLSKVFNGSISSNATSISDLIYELNPPAPENRTANITLPPSIPSAHLGLEALRLFSHLGYPVDPRCVVDKPKLWYRTVDGSCNWLKKDEISEGAVGIAKARDYNQH